MKRRVGLAAFIAYFVGLVLVPAVASIAVLVAALNSTTDRPRLLYLASILAAIAFIAFRYLPALRGDGREPRDS